MRSAVAIGLLVVLSACSATPKPAPASAEPAPENYREIVAESARRIYFDPYSIRDARITAPQWMETWDFSGDGWVACVEANAKNRMGAYTGIAYTAFLIRGGKVTSNLQMELADGGWYCSKREYLPFPELDSAAATPSQSG